MAVGRTGAIMAMAVGTILGSGTATADGAAVYTTICTACHQPDAEGAPGLAPPLAGTLANRARTEAGRSYFAQVLISGMIGPIVTRDGKFNGNMPSFAALPDEDLIAVIGHVLKTFNGVDEAVRAEDFAAARSKNLQPNEVSRLREQIRKQIGD
jgi:mono/diheme cytochrome c family protein